MSPKDDESKPIMTCFRWYFFGIGWIGLLALVGLTRSTLASDVANEKEGQAGTFLTDVTFRGGAAASMDRLLVVGDRGTVALSENGGKSWHLQAIGTEANLHGVDFESPRVGWIVGGSIESYSHRSAGEIYRTRDGGQRWERLEASELPRLTGVQSLGQGHLIAWGDWSPPYLSGLFESWDGGGQWSPKSLPTTHLQTAVWLDHDRGLVVDRLSRVFYCETGRPPELLRVGGDPTTPLLAAAANESGWWLAGAKGTLFWSPDGRTWEPRQVPGTASDHQAITFQAIAVAGSHCWLAGMPGNTVWHSEDQGRNWQIEETGTQLPLHTLFAANADSLVAAGMLGSIQGTRNRGQAWWSMHQANAKIGLLDIATTVDQIAWDALHYTACESRHQVAGVVLHSRRLHERADAYPDEEARLMSLVPPLEIAHLSIEPSFPVGDRSSSQTMGSWNPVDLHGYRAPNGEEVAPIVRRLVMWIRMLRPDVIIHDESIGDPLGDAYEQAIQLARRLAGRADVSLYSAASGIQLRAWETPRMLGRRPAIPHLGSRIQRRPDLGFSPTTALKSSGRLLAEKLGGIPPTLEKYWEPSFAHPSDRMFEVEGEATRGRLYADYLVTHGSAQGVNKDRMLNALPHATASRRAAALKERGSLQSMMAQSQHGLLKQRLLDMPPSDEANDGRWQAALRSLIQTLPVAARGDTLWELAQACRRRGQWTRWEWCLEGMMSHAPKDGIAELAALHLLQYRASHEMRWMRRQTALNQDRTALAFTPEKLGGNRAITSPFSTKVVQASHQEIVPAAVDIADDREQLAELRTRILQRYPHLQWDPRFLLIDAALSRQAPPTEASGGPSVGLNHLAHQAGPFAWQRLAYRELAGDGPSSLLREENYRVPHAPQRPHLDGRFDDPAWRASPIWRLINLRDGDNQPPTEIRFAFDAMFLYLSANCVSEKDRQADKSSSLPPDRLTIRLDVDRDYLSWFELQIDADGKVVERCMDLEWKPAWYVKTTSDTQGWQCEAAIPLDQLTSASPIEGSLWGIALERQLPSGDPQSNHPLVTGRMESGSFGWIHFGE